MAERTDKRVTALMTAESILVGFLFAYAPIFNQTLVYWSHKGAPLIGTVVAALLVYALALAAFRSILLLYKSIGSGNPYDKNYRAGYDLFLLVILGAVVYVLMNAVSIVQFAWTGRNVSVPDEHLSIVIATSLFAVWAILVLLIPLPITGCVRYIKNKLGTRLLWALVVLCVFVDVVLATVIGIEAKNPLQVPLLLGWPWPLLLEWPWHLLPAIFLALTILAIWMLMMPENSTGRSA